MLHALIAISGLYLSGIAAAPEVAQATKAPATDSAAQTAAPAHAYKKPQPLRFIRLRQDESGNAAALQVAFVRYEPIDGSKLSVTLYGAVHIGDVAYYQKLNGAFTQHEALLFELANDPAVLKQRDSAQPSLLSMLQLDMAGLLELSDQLTEIDYDRPNFVHADIPVGELFQRAQDQGDDLLTITTQTLLDMHRMMKRGEDPMRSFVGSAPGDPAENNVLSAMLGGGDPRKLKVDLAAELAQSSEGGILEGITVLNRYLIEERNERCLEVLTREIESGKTDFGIFYGAGHNADLNRRLMVDFGLKPVAVQWVDAWNLQVRKGPRELSEEQLLIELLRRLVENQQ